MDSEKKSKDIVGKKLPCKFCGSEATVVLEDRRYFVRCAFCGANTYLKTYNQLSITQVL